MVTPMFVREPTNLMPAVLFLLRCNGWPEAIETDLATVEATKRAREITVQQCEELTEAELELLGSLTVRPWRGEEVGF